MNAAAKSIIPWLVIIGILAIGVVLVAPAFAPRRYARPPFPVQREQQRKTVRERVQAAGGWEVLRRECESLFTNGSRGFRWEPPHHAVVVPDPMHAPSESYETNIDYGPLPPALASLRPQEVRAYALDEQPFIARIKLFGMHMTGTRGVPYYGLWIICGPAAEGYTPELDFSGVTVTGEIKKLTNSVFEVY